ncbi:MAG: aldehyde dehydrogenase family protein [Acidobacteria bacterium]|nr:aldehyde dehydrogenase family protein [Acidobacteriota bacterium]
MSIEMLAGSSDPGPRPGAGGGARMLIGGRWIARRETIDVRNPFDRQLVDTVPHGTADDINAAIAAATEALDTPWPTHARYDMLMRAAALLDADRAAYAQTIALEGSKTIREAEREPVRCVTLLRLAAEEGRRLCGETLPFDSRPGSENRAGYFFRFPVGVVGAITPFNDPLSMACHKVGPAIAAGNAVVLKPGTATPLSALRLAQDLVAAGLPAGRLNVVTGHGRELGDAIASSPRVRLVTFTGGVETGVHITRVAGIKKLSMELGSNSPVIVMPDARLDRAVPAIAAGAFAQAGQNCLGVQRVLVHADIYETFRDRFVSHVAGLKAGSSMDEATDVCAMITLAQADRVEQWIREAQQGGGRVLVGGHREGAVVWPTVLEDVPDQARLTCDEVYGPVVSLYRVRTLDDAIARANRVEYGLHAAIFTESVRDAFAAIHGLHVGGVMVNDSTDYRLDVMPFGGTKLSGIGREGIRFAVQDMTETRVACFNL